MNPFSRKYRYLGYTGLSIPEGWVPIVKETILQIDREVKPKWIPRFILNWISDLAMGGSVVMVKNRFFYRIYTKLTKGILITDIKDKYAGIRIYGFFNDKIDEYISWAEILCDNTCEQCGSHREVEIRGKHWYYNLCKKCYGKDK